VRLAGGMPLAEAWSRAKHTWDGLLVPAMPPETFGMIVAEALAARVPVIAFGSELAVPAVTATVLQSTHPVHAAGQVIRLLDRFHREPSSRHVSTAIAHSAWEHGLSPRHHALRFAGLAECIQRCARGTASLHAFVQSTLGAVQPATRPDDRDATHHGCVGECARHLAKQPQ
jgi:hypothetical protein